jgi:L1 cell adhesion molecule like protein
MSLIGLDFGTHCGSISLWDKEKDSIEVIADDLGSRTIPTVVAFRGDEIIVGQAAVSQQHKNSSNTFEDVRSLLLNSPDDKETIFIPAIDKDIAVSELCTHYFRNIHNQVKQQTGNVVRDCVISLPSNIDESIKSRIITAAQAGGIRIKSIIPDSSAILLAYELDDNKFVDAKSLVIDIGWSKTSLSLFHIRGGCISLIGETSSNVINGSVMVRLAAEHCAKEFQRKAKFSCMDNERSMFRLRKECENAIRTLSISAEASINIDSLCEGVDYSSRLSRARFEDICAIPYMQLRTAITEALTGYGIELEQVTHVSLAGGFSMVNHHLIRPFSSTLIRFITLQIPKTLATVKTLFPHAAFPRPARLDPAEAQCIGASIHGRHLSNSVCRFIFNSPFLKKKI